MKKIFCVLLVLSMACKESYVPPVVSSNISHLVVEGFINNGADTTWITLSHTYKLDDSASVTPELNAQVYVEDKNGSAYPLSENGNGVYIAPGLSLNPSLQYRLHIRTSGGKNYASDYVELKTSPPIDSIGWTDSDAGLQIYANTHDPQNVSHYYRYEYNETWEFHSVYFSYFKYENRSISSRYPNLVYTCWKSTPSTTVLLASSAKLASDVIYQAPLVLIPNSSWKISVMYSILVKQYVLTTEGYNFWLNLQKNSEQIGSIFSPQPSESKGNVHNLSDSTEQVIGFVSAGTMQQKRVYFTPGELPNWHLQFYTDACSEMSIPDNPDSLEHFLGSGYAWPIDYSTGVIGVGVRYDIAPRECADCTLTGSNQKPYFWP
ncbi:MAG TPA: DUF4249 domain-containing protein [Puia sp.]|nr:DUF4249 domain-containing protein [Puia sp.]